MFSSRRVGSGRISEKVRVVVWLMGGWLSERYSSENSPFTVAHQLVWYGVGEVLMKDLFEKTSREAKPNEALTMWRK